MAVRTEKHTNIVLFGQSGAGKSSLVNLMAEEEVAITSNDLTSCTLCWKEYSIEFGGESYKVFDTVGLEEPQLGIPQYLDAIENAYRLIQDLKKQGGIDLLLFCMRAGRLTSTLQSNYRLFHEFLCDKDIPVVVVITHLEHEKGKMDDWWTRNEEHFVRRQVHVAGHACITAIEGNCPGRYEESCTTIRKLVKEFAAEGKKKKLVWFRNGGIADNWFISFVFKVTKLLAEKMKKTSSVKKQVTSDLISRCGMPPKVAEQLADMMKNDVVERVTS
jgi:tRNA U34 5-carboxymethylaminomethyl modifying GTPase MnmE/TrmE